MGITFRTDTDCTLRAYSDSDWAGCKTTRRSTGGYCTFLGTNLISWSSKKQDTVAKSSTEAEYRSMSDTASELTWISLVLKDLGVPLTETPELFCDNLSAVYLTANPTYHARTKHFETHHHYVRERVALGSLLVRHIPSQLQIADIFTKSLPIQPFSELRFKLGVENPPTPSLRGTISESRHESPLSAPEVCKHQISGRRSVKNENDGVSKTEKTTSSAVGNNMQSRKRRESVVSSHEKQHEAVDKIQPAKQIVSTASGIQSKMKTQPSINPVKSIKNQGTAQIETAHRSNPKLQKHELSLSLKNQFEPLEQEATD